MFRAMTPFARRTALAIALMSAVSVAAQALYLNATRAEPMLATVLEMARYFTILTHGLLVLTLLFIARPLRDGVPEPWLAALTLSIAMVAAVYHALLSHLIDFTGLGWWADQGLHTVVPGALVLWWLAHAPKRQLRFADLPIFALWPSLYGAYVLARGARDGIYPYPFIDLTTISVGAAALNMAGLLVMFLLGGVGMIAIGRFADR